MKLLLSLLLCCLIQMGYSQLIPIERTAGGIMTDSALAGLHRWEDSACIDGNGIRLLRKYNDYVENSRQNLRNCIRFIRIATWDIEKGDKISAAEDIRKADLYNKRANVADIKAQYYLGLIHKRCKKKVSP